MLIERRERAGSADEEILATSEVGVTGRPTE